MSSGASFQDYEREYNATLSRVRGYLAQHGGSRNEGTLRECDRLLKEARHLATAMQGLAEVEGNAMRVRETQLLIERDLSPLQKEIQRSLMSVQRNSSTGNVNQQQQQQQRQELFYQPPNTMQQHQQQQDMESLIRSSESMLLESQTVLAETEHIGANTLHQMGQQREQLQNANANARAVQDVAIQAGMVLTNMSRKTCRSKLALYTIIFTLLIANLWVIIKICTKNKN